MLLYQPPLECIIKFVKNIILLTLEFRLQYYVLHIVNTSCDELAASNRDVNFVLIQLTEYSLPFMTRSKFNISCSRHMNTINIVPAAS